MQRASFAIGLVALLSACGNSSSSSDQGADSGLAQDDGVADSAMMEHDANDSAVADSAVADVAPDAPFSVVNVPSRLTAGGTAACAISATGIKQCWGGRQGTIYRSFGTYLAVDAVDTTPNTAQGNPAFCFIYGDGSLACGTSLSTGGGSGSAPGPYVDVNVGYAGHCAIRATGELECSTGSGLARVGTASDWKRVSVGHSHKIAINAAGKLFGWGTNAWGESAPGGSGSLMNPTVIDSAHVYRDADATSDAACAVRSDGELYCWGNKSTLFTKSGTAPLTRIGTDSDWTSVRVAQDHGCGLKSTGALYCWGLNGYGQLGRGTVTHDLSPQLEPEQVGSDTDWVDVAVDRNTTCARKASGSVLCWGSNLDGSLGLGYNDHKRPAKIGDGYRAITANGATTCAITTLGALQCWGMTNPLGGSLRQQTPQAVGTGTFRGIALGEKTFTGMPPLSELYFWYRSPAHYGCARGNDDALHCFGSDKTGEVGLGGSSSSTLAAVGLSAKEVAVGFDRSCAITPAGALYCWGLGVKTPTAVGTGTWQHVAVGLKSAFAIANDTSLHTVPPGTTSISDVGWTALAAKGERDAVYGIRSGRLHVISAEGVVGTVSYDSNTDYIAIALGSMHQCAVRATGQLNCWGTDRFGGAFGGGSDVGWDLGWTRSWTAVAAGDYHTCGIRNSGELYCWGLNENGQIGDNTAFRDKPAVVPL